MPDTDTDWTAADAVTQDVLAEVAAEREAQHRKWGEQNHPWISPGVTDPAVQFYCHGWLAADMVKDYVNQVADTGHLDYAAIALEEYAEALEARHDPVALRAELVQCAAVFVAAIESLDRNGR